MADSAMVGELMHETFKELLIRTTHLSNLKEVACMPRVNWMSEWEFTWPAALFLSLSMLSSSVFSN